MQKEVRISKELLNKRGLEEIELAPLLTSSFAVHFEAIQIANSNL
jgi:hypothetical protein